MWFWGVKMYSNCGEISGIKGAQNGAKNVPDQSGHGKDVFAIISTDFRKCLFFQLFLLSWVTVAHDERPGWANRKSEIIWKESDEDKVTDWECEIVIGSLHKLGLTLVHTTPTVHWHLCLNFAHLFWFSFSWPLFASHPGVGRHFMLCY